MKFKLSSEFLEFLGLEFLQSANVIRLTVVFLFDLLHFSVLEFSVLNVVLNFFLLDVNCVFKSLNVFLEIVDGSIKLFLLLIGSGLLNGKIELQLLDKDIRVVLNVKYFLLLIFNLSLGANEIFFQSCSDFTVL